MKIGAILRLEVVPGVPYREKKKCTRRERGYLLT